MLRNVCPGEPKPNLILMEAFHRKKWMSLFNLVLCLLIFFKVFISQLNQMKAREWKKNGHEIVITVKKY